MSNEKNASTEGNQDHSHPDPYSDLTDEQLLDVYLAIPKKARDLQFADTAAAAEIADVSQRTIEYWIETGSVRAVLISKKYKVSLASLIAYLKRRSRQRKRRL